MFGTIFKNLEVVLKKTSTPSAEGYDFNWLVGRVARTLEIETKDVLAPGKYAQTAKARRLLCYWAARELGLTTLDLAR